MNQHIRKTKGVAPNHPVPVAGDPFLFDLDKCGDGYNQPYDIQRIETHTGYFSSGGIRRHVSRGQHDEKYGH